MNKEELREKIRKITYERYGEIALYGDITQEGADEIIYLCEQAFLERAIEVVRKAVKQYGQNSVAYIHEGDSNVKVIEALTNEFKQTTR